MMALTTGSHFPIYSPQLRSKTFKNSSISFFTLINIVGKRVNEIFEPEKNQRRILIRSLFAKRNVIFALSCVRNFYGGAAVRSYFIVIPTPWSGALTLLVGRFGIKSD